MKSASSFGRSRPFALACLFILTSAPVWGQAQEKEASTDPKVEFEKLSKSYADAIEQFMAAFQQLETDEARQKYYEEHYPKPDATALKMLEIARANPGKPVGFEAIQWAIQNRVQGEARSGALDLLAAHYLEEPSLGQILPSLAMDPAPSTGKFLKTVMSNAPERDVKGAAHFHYAKHLQTQVQAASYIKSMSGEDRKQITAFFGEESIAHLEKLDAAKTVAEMEKLLEKVVAEYADVSSGRPGSIGEIAKRDLFEIRNLSVGKVAPEIKGEDLHGKEFALSEYRGKVIFLDFWGDW